MRRDIVVFLMCLAGCGREATQFEVSSWTLSHESAPLALSAVSGKNTELKVKTPLQAAELSVLDGPPLRFSLVEDPFSGASIRGEQLGVSLSDVRLEKPVWGEEKGFVEAKAESLSLPVRVLDQVVSVLVDEVSASGSFAADQRINGKFSGHITKASAATALEQLASKLKGSTTLDVDQDGKVSVVFDRKAGRFLHNELAFLFDIAQSGQPCGFFGEWFSLDADKDGAADSMLVELSFEAKSVASH
jgi:hypothetical protein